MIITHLDPSKPAKGWYELPELPALPWIGFATQGIPEPHHHRQMCEVYLVASGSSTLLVNGAAVELDIGDVMVVEAGEEHTFVASSPDYFHFVLQCPRVVGDKVLAVQGAAVRPVADSQRQDLPRAG
jgi:uncharacterized protein YjlB